MNKLKKKKKEDELEGVFLIQKELKSLVKDKYQSIVESANDFKSKN